MDLRSRIILRDHDSHTFSVSDPQLDLDHSFSVDQKEVFGFFVSPSCLRRTPRSHLRKDVKGLNPLVTNGAKWQWLVDTFPSKGFKLPQFSPQPLLQQTKL